MTTHIPRDSYSQEELAKLYPKELELQLVQILLRHGERTPVSPRFQNTGLQPYWPYCNAARQLSSVIMSTQDFTRWDQLKYRRRIETFGVDDGPVIASGPSNEFDAVCQPGELTDKGRQTTLALGQRLRHLYVDQLQFMPKLIADSDSIYLRATPIPRALESVQQAFWGFYPPSARTADFPPPTIITRTPADETLFPNDASCRRFGQLSRAFAQRSAERWNDSDDMQYLSKLFSQYMPDQAKVAVDSRPRLSGIMDTINATDAHGPATKLPKAFYDPKARAIIDKVAVEEWFSGYAESAEYRMLGIGALLGDVTARMAGSIEGRGRDGLLEIGGREGGRGGETKIKLALSGCHDTTLAAALSSLGAFEGEKWPPFTSHVAFELFRKKKTTSDATDSAYTPPPTRSSTPSLNDSAPPAAGTWWSSLFGRAPSPITSSPSSSSSSSPPDGIARKPLSSLTPAQRASLDGYYVRVRYNDRIMHIPACQAAGKHLEGDPSLCTLETFKAVVDQFTPRSWKAACSSRLEEPAFPVKPEPAGLE